MAPAFLALAQFSGSYCSVDLVAHSALPHGTPWLIDWRLALIALWTHWLFAQVCMALVLALSASWDLLALTRALSRSQAALAFALTLAFQLWYLAYQLWLSCIVALVRFCSSSGCFYHQWCPSMRNFALDRVSACKHFSSASRQLAALAF